MISTWLRLSAGLFVCVALVQRAQAQRSPLDLLDIPQAKGHSVAVHPGKSNLADVPSDFPQTGQLEDPDRITTNTNRILTNIRYSATQYRATKQKITRDKENLNRLQAQADSLRSEKLQALQELREGKYCSRCNRTASEIEHDEKISFRQHLDKVDGREIAATEEKINAKAHEYDEKIRKIDAEGQRLQREVKDLSLRMQQDASTVLSGTTAWEDAMAKEDDLRASQWLRRFDEAKKQLQALKTALNVNSGQIQKIVAREHPHSGTVTVLDHTLTELNDAASELRRSIRELFGQFQSDAFKHDQARAAFDQRASEGLEALQGCVREVERFATPSLSSAPKLSAGSLSLETNGGRPGASGLQVKASFGHFKAALEMSNDWFRHTTSIGVYAGMDTPYGFTGVGMKKTTTFHNGITNTRDDLAVKKPIHPKSGNELLGDTP